MKKVTLSVLICALFILLMMQVTWAAPPPSNPSVHIVRWGENLTGIARRYGTTIQAIGAANQLANPNHI